MSLAIDIFGYRYEDSEPSFVDADAVNWWHRPTKRVLTKASVTAWMTANSKSMASGESGDLSVDWLLNNSGRPVAYPTPLVAVIAGTGTLTATVTFSGGESPAAGTILAAVTVNDGADKVIVLSNPTITKGMTADEAATAYAAELDGAQDAGASVTLAASAVGSVVTITESGGATIVSVAATIT